MGDSKIDSGCTGLHQNYFRDYDPAIGRYVESDPIGLGGGTNTYAYTSNRPVSLTDTFGLVSVAGLGNSRVPSANNGCGCMRWPDYVTFHIDYYVLSVSATFTRSGDIFVGNGFSDNIGIRQPPE